MRKSGKPDFRCIHVFGCSEKEDVDARHKAGHDEWKMSRMMSQAFRIRDYRLSAG
jgi:hypothetical protein